MGAFAVPLCVFPDTRGAFVAPFQRSIVEGTIKEASFQIAQTALSVSRAGVVRGMHFTAVPPGNAKYVYCTSGAVRDMVLDVREGSPTFGRWDSAILTVATEQPEALFLPVGVAHGFLALEDDSVMSYLMTEEYVAEAERAVSIFDPNLGLPLPIGGDYILSDRDRQAPTLQELLLGGLLPKYEECLAAERAGAQLEPRRGSAAERGESRSTTAV
jgi:epimerase EvaD